MTDGPRTITLRSRVPPAAAGGTLLAFLADRFRYHDPDAWRERIADGRVTVDDARVGADHRLVRGAVVAYRRDTAEPEVSTDMRIVHDADGIVVVDKPAGLPMHADGAFVTRTVVGVLAKRLGARLRPVQRLDRETSGLCVLARNRESARLLGEVLAAGGFAKVYEALVTGRITADHLQIDAPIARDVNSRVSIRRTTVEPTTPGADPASTAVRVLARGTDATWIECRPTTGRTHQIRVHLESVGHPLLGDKLYGRSDDEFLAWVAAVKAGGPAATGSSQVADRQMLHASRLDFDDPRTAQRFTFEAPLPADFIEVAARHGCRPCPAS